MCIVEFYGCVPRILPNPNGSGTYIEDLIHYRRRGVLFGLRNAGATYQRLVNIMFKDEIGKSMEVYVDDMLVKSKAICNHIHDLSKCFATLRRYGMKLNP